MAHANLAVAPVHRLPSYASDSVMMFCGACDGAKLKYTDLFANLIE